MNIPEKIEIWKRKIVELEKEVSSLEKDKSSLIYLSDDVKSRQNIKLETSLEGIDLEEEISYLNDWIGYHKNKVKYYKDRIRISEKLREKDEIAAEINEAAKEARIKFSFGKIIEKSPRYAVPLIVILVIATSFFLLKPAITGQVILNKEAAYTNNLNLVINESGAYEWNIRNPGNIKSIKASGSVIGNGTVKVYIEKDGKRYLIFDNKK